MTSIATEIKLMQLNDNVFEIQNKEKVAPAIWSYFCLKKILNSLRG
jgi:hypothetical protein